MIPVQEAAGYSVALLGFSMYNAAKMGYFDRLQLLNTSPLSLIIVAIRRLRTAFGLPAADEREMGSIALLGDRQDEFQLKSFFGSKDSAQSNPNTPINGRSIEFARFEGDEEGGKSFDKS